MLDLKFIRENPELVKENIRKKHQEEKVDLVDQLLKADEKRRKLMQKAQRLRHERNEITEEINKAKKAGTNVSDLIKKAKDIPAEIKTIEEKQKELDEEIKGYLFRIPNIIHESVPLGKDDSENVEIKTFGEPRQLDFEVKNHAELAESLGVADFDTATDISGRGFYILKGDLALLNMALINYARDYMVKQGFEYVEPPLMIRREVLDGVYSHEEIEEQAYKIEDEDLYLIATAEHPLIGMYINKTLDKKDLPVKITGYSACFRKEIGSHGIDEKGLFRTHQFHKQEMIVICEPENSYKFYDEMLEHSVNIFKGLGLPFRILECCSGDLADLKAKSCDLEAWSPRQNKYFEITSLTNMEAAQARRLNIKATDGKEKYMVHTLNNTVIATSRAMVAILENYQNKDGTVTVPEALVPYMGGKTVIG
ncbi:MAG: serine--tRNA ligase [Candidatus Woesearchaeota archaeon]